MSGLVHRLRGADDESRVRGEILWSTDVAAFAAVDSEDDVQLFITHVADSRSEAELCMWWASIEPTVGWTETAAEEPLIAT